MIPILDPGLSPFTGFGDDINASIKFGILAPSGRMPNWTGGGATINRFRILHSNDVIKQYGGRDERVLVARLRFAAWDALEALDLVVGREATLRLPWGVTARAGGTQQVIADVAYLTLPGTELGELTEQKRYRDGTAIATATFRRPVGVGTLYDYAHYAEGDE
jgi:hypothetical protein